MRTEYLLILVFIVGIFLLRIYVPDEIQNKSSIPDFMEEYYIEEGLVIEVVDSLDSATYYVSWEYVKETFKECREVNKKLLKQLEECKNKEHYGKIKRTGFNKDYQEDRKR